MKHLLAIFSVCIAVPFHAASQCTPPVTPPVITCGTGTPLVDNAVISTGQTYSFNGTNGAFSNISINGGTLLLCGSVTITNLNFNGGTLVINPGAVVTFDGNFSAGDNNFFNAGTVVFNFNISIQGTNTFVYNAAGASMTVNGSFTIFNAGLFINNGATVAQGIILNSGADICFGPNSTSSTTSIVNNETNAVIVPTGTACVSYSTSFTGNNAVTATPSLIICQNPGASAPAPVVTGAATLVSGCTSCSVALPLKLLTFQGKLRGTEVVLEWKTDWEENMKSFAVERSVDGQDFETIGAVTPHNRPSTYTFTASLKDNSYFRLKMIDEDGRFTYSPMLLMKVPAAGFHMSVLSNPVTGSYIALSVYLPGKQTGEITIIDKLGRPIRKIPVSFIKGNNTLQVDLKGIVAGQYYLYFSGSADRSAPFSFIRL